MFLLGHSSWSYVLSKLTGQGLRVNLPAYLALLSGVLPDFDIYFQPYIIHHTYTHSILVLGPVAAILSYKFRRLGIAFSIGLFSHLLTDYLVGSIPLLYPVYPDLIIGLNLGLPSLADTVLELGAFLVLIVYAFINGDYKLILKPSKDSLMLAIPLVAIITLTLLFAGDNNIALSSFAFSRKALTFISLGHIAMVGILAYAAIRGLFPYLRRSRIAARPASTA